LLAERGHLTKLAVVMMESPTHVVCFVQEARGFLDFNRRAEPHPIVATDGSLKDIANKVAEAFRSRWWMASEVEHRDDKVVFLDNVFQSAPASKAGTPEPVEDGHAQVDNAPLEGQSAMPQRPPETDRASSPYAGELQNGSSGPTKLRSKAADMPTLWCDPYSVLQAQHER
jgi:hypothetical protein